MIPNYYNVGAVVSTAFFMGGAGLMAGLSPSIRSNTFSRLFMLVAGDALLSVCEIYHSRDIGMSDADTGFLVLMVVVNIIILGLIKNRYVLRWAYWDRG